MTMDLPRKPRATKRRGRHPDKALSAAFCRSVAEAGRYADGNGLYLHVDPSGARRWVQRLVIRGRSRALGLGSYALVSLAEAREKALANRKAAREGGDPLADRRRSEGIPTFEEAVEQVIAIHGEAWRAGKTPKQWRASLRDHVLPHLGGKSVDQVTTADVMTVLLPIWTRKHAMARSVRQRIGTVMRWAIAQGYRSDNPAGDAVTAALPKLPRVIRHFPALPHGEVGAALAGVRVSQAWTGTKLAFELLVLTAARSGEVRMATWDEFDLAALVWTVPAARMKANREHRVPLCGRAVEVLREAERLRDVVASVERAGLVFPSRRGKVLSDMVFWKLVKQQRLECVAARLPLVVPGLGGGEDRPSAGGDRGGSGARGGQPDGGGLRALGPVRAAAAADGRVGGVSGGHPACELNELRPGGGDPRRRAGARERRSRVPMRSGRPIALFEAPAGRVVNGAGGWVEELPARGSGAGPRTVVRPCRWPSGRSHGVVSVAGSDDRV